MLPNMFLNHCDTYQYTVEYVTATLALTFIVEIPITTLGCGRILPKLNRGRGFS